MPKIHLFTSYTQDNPERLDMSRSVAAQQKGYCEQLGYTYSVFEENLAKTNPKDPILPYWSKIAGINRLLESPHSGEWIVWLDDDAIVLNPVSMEKFIREHGGADPSTHIIVTNDIPSAPTRLNTGVLIVRNSQESRQFFSDLWDMRNTPIPDTPYTYSTCPNQQCLHEQQAMDDLLLRFSAFNKPDYTGIVKIIPQKDDSGLGTNAFQRESHYDLNRKMSLNYNDPKESKCDTDTDFICQCTGLATQGMTNTNRQPRNLRKECIDELIHRAHANTARSKSSKPPKKTRREKR